MASDSELIERLRDFLSKSDLNTTTNAIVRRRLEEDFGIDLSDRKAFIREQVDEYTRAQFENSADNEEIDGEEVEAEEGNEEEEEGIQESSTASTAKSSTKKRPKKNEAKKRSGGGGFTKLCSLSPELQKFTGVPELARTEVVKQLWKYIKENKLQDPSNKRNIVCDETLRNLFSVDTIDMFQMNKALTKHIWPLNSDGAAPPVNVTPKEKQPKRERDEDEDEPKKKVKRPSGGNSAFLKPLKLSEALVKFLGTGESELPRSGVIKRIWDYIKLNNLQDPADRRQILCDEKLKELFNVDTFHGFSMAKHLTAHLIKTEQTESLEGKITEDSYGCEC